MPRAAACLAPYERAQLAPRVGGERRRRDRRGRRRCRRYNHTGRDYVTKKRDRGLKHVALTAKEIIREALPIQCVEAVFLGCYLTSEMSDLERFPLSFKSAAGGHVYRHIVLAVQHSGSGTGKWGAIGISRRDTLMYKELKFASLSALVWHFKECYEACTHEVEGWRRERGRGHRHYGSSVGALMC